MSNPWKQDFPIFTSHPKLVYLDSAATSQKPQAVIDAVQHFYMHTNANVHRGLYSLSQDATGQFETVRASVANFLGAKHADEIIFTGGTNESINLVAQGWARKFLKAGDIIVVSHMEHHANLVPWQQLQEMDVELYSLPLTDDYRLDYKVADRLDMKRVKLLALTHASNVLGTINPIADIATYFKESGADARLLVDAAQSAPHLLGNVQDLGADFLVFSSHKLLGPSGVGVLYARRELLTDMDPLLVGSHMVARVTLESATWATAPDKFEPGTRNLEGTIGLGAAINYLSALDKAALHEHEHDLSAYALERLASVAGLQLFGPKTPEDRLGIFSFQLNGAHPHDVSEILDRSGIAVRAGHHCAQPLMQQLGVPGTVRASLHLYNSRSDVDALITGLERREADFEDHVMDPTADPLYREVILEHWQHPQNHGVIADAHFDVERDNPLCGDRIRLTGRIQDGKLTDIAFTNEGCAISTASASILTDEIKGRTLAEIKQLTETDALALLGIALTPARTKCALLAYVTLITALQ